MYIALGTMLAILIYEGIKSKCTLNIFYSGKMRLLNFFTFNDKRKLHNKKLHTYKQPSNESVISQWITTRCLTSKLKHSFH